MDLSDLDFTFGLFENYPGIKQMLTIEGPVLFTQGFLNGTQMTKDKNVYQCERLIYEDIIGSANDIFNISGTMIATESGIENVYNLFDLLNSATRILESSYPISVNCWEAGFVVSNHFVDVYEGNNGLDPKNYLMNVVYNFGHIFDAFRNVYLFLKQDPRGLVDNVHDTGYSLGLAVYYIITPDLAEYDVYNDRQRELLRRQEELEKGM